ncbi:hypothetical protein J14TS5_51940 [Paenibacillus lautus]|nr:hypothetical protein J14TS5_51940 [Paenibacillus lautus]
MYQNNPCLRSFLRVIDGYGPIYVIHQIVYAIGSMSQLDPHQICGSDNEITIKDYLSLPFMLGYTCNL